MTELSEQIKELYASGKSYRDIAKELGCSKGTISYHMGPGQKEKTADNRSKYRKQIMDFIQEYKTDQKCADCRDNYPYWVMQFDHIGDKLFNIGNFRQHTQSLGRIKQEIAKCEVVCANCHANRTHLRRSQEDDSSTMLL